MDNYKTEELAANRKRLSAQAETVRAQSEGLRKTSQSLLAATAGAGAGFELSHSPYFKSLFEGLPFSAVIFKRTGDDFVIVDYNPAALTLTNGRIPEHLGKTAGELYRLDPELLTKFALCFETRTPQEHATPYRMPGTDDDKLLQMRLAFVPPDHVLLITIDVTERKRADDQILRFASELEQRVKERTALLAETIDQLEQENRERKGAQEQVARLNDDLEQRATALESANKELDAFSYSVSHDLRAPLSMIEGFSRLLLDEYGSLLPEGGLSFLNNVYDNAVAMEQLVQALLSFSRASRAPLEKVWVDMNSLVRQVIEGLREGLGERQIEFVVADLPKCEADATLLKQVWVNLISNAIKFTRRRDQASIEVGYAAQDGGVAYFVRDNGVGFDEEQAHKLFGVFQRLHGEEEFEGTGVGLAIVERIIRRHGGRAWAEGQADRGATFYFTLGSA